MSHGGDDIDLMLVKEEPPDEHWIKVEVDIEEHDLLEHPQLRAPLPHLAQDAPADSQLHRDDNIAVTEALQNSSQTFLDVDIKREPISISKECCNDEIKTEEDPDRTAKKSKAQKQREYRQRIAATRTRAELIAARAADTERKRNYRLRVAAELAEFESLYQTTTASSEVQPAKSSQSEYRQRVAASRTPAEVIAARAAETERKRNYRQRVAAELADCESLNQSTTASSEVQQAKSTQSEYRPRVAASRTPAKVITARAAVTERKRNYKQLIAAISAHDSLESTTASSSPATGSSTLAAEPVQTTVHPSTSSDLVEITIFLDHEIKTVDQDT